MNKECIEVTDLALVLLALREKDPADYPLPRSIYEVTIEIPYAPEQSRLHPHKFFFKRLLTGKKKTGGVTNEAFWKAATDTLAYNITLKESFDGSPVLRYCLLCFTDGAIATNLLDSITERVNHHFDEFLTGLQVMCLNGVIQSAGIEQSMVWKPHSEFGAMSKEEIKQVTEFLSLHNVRFYGGTLERVANEIGIIP